MKYFSFVILIGLFCLSQSACVSYNSSVLNINNHTSYPNIGYINAIPFPKHNKPIHVFMGSEQPKDKDYIKLATLEETAEVSVSYGTLVKRLIVKAQYIGADAIFVLGKRHTKEDIYDDEGYFSHYDSEKHVSALAIKYLKNISGIEQFPKSAVYYKHNHEKQIYEPYCINTLNMNGSVIKRNTANNYEQFVRPFSLDYLLYDESSNWRYKVNNNQITTRVHYNFQYKQQTNYRITYDSLDRVHQVFNKTKKWDIEFFYNDEGQLVQKKIYSRTFVLTGQNRRGKEKYKMVNRGVIRRELLQYDANNRLISKEIFKISQGKELPWIKVIYSDFYTKADLEVLSSKNYIE